MLLFRSQFRRSMAMAQEHMSLRSSANSTELQLMGSRGSGLSHKDESTQLCRCGLCALVSYRTSQDRAINLEANIDLIFLGPQHFQYISFTPLLQPL
jgi:hypothetical protein